jgi:hypothetical protein
MPINLLEKCSELSNLEKDMIRISTIQFNGSYEHWTLLNTINHVLAWENSAMKKVEARIRNEEVKFHSDKSLDDVNRLYYDKTKSYTTNQTIDIIESTLEKEKEVIGKIKGHEESKGYAPIGYIGIVYEYLVFDLIYHPINHYAFYALKNNEYKVFLEIEKYISTNRSSLFNDLGTMNLKEFATREEIKVLFEKGYEWEHDELYIQIKKSYCLNSERLRHPWLRRLTTIDIKTHKNTSPNSLPTVRPRYLIIWNPDY